MSSKFAFTQPSTEGYTRAAFLVGMPIAHSGSPFLHRTIYDSLPTPQPTWGQILCETTDLASYIAFLRSEPKAMGSGVTMPFKVAVIPYLDELTPEASAIGAVNTIFFRTGPNGERRFCGTNTDCIGIRDAFRFNVPAAAVESYRGRPGLVVGGGGTCRAAIYSLQRMLGCTTVYVINRDKSEVDAVIAECAVQRSADETVGEVIHVQTVAQAATLPTPAAIVSAIPDFTPQTPAEQAVRDILTEFMSRPEQKGALLEMCYHPSPNTQIAQLTAATGWQVIGGIEAMIGQGIAQATFWTGLEIPTQVREKSRDAVRAKNEKSNATSTTRLTVRSDETKKNEVVTVDYVRVPSKTRTVVTV